MAATAPTLALRNFDSLYSKVFGRGWPSARLALLSPKKYCLIVNSFLDPNDQTKIREEDGYAISLARYYKRHLYGYHKELQKDSKNSVGEGVLNEIQPDTPSEAEGSVSSAEDLMLMFSDRRIDDDEKYFLNRASTHLNLNTFVPTKDLITREHISNDLAYYDTYDPNLRLDIDRIEEPPLEFNSELEIFSFPRGSWSQFDQPKADNKANLMSHYLLDGASILPVLALDIQFNDECADYCAAPGGKSLAMLMSLRPQRLLCNDVSSSRLGRMYTLLRQYVPNIKYIKDTLKLSNRDSTMLVFPDQFDKILVDVPCSEDRFSVKNLDNNMFSRKRSNERLNLPLKQCDILVSALKSIRPNGSVVYSTCTMSPIENDSVVQRALMRLQLEDHEARFAVVSLKEAFRPLRGIYKFHSNDFGQLVMPSITSNFGPMYISKIKRLS